MKCELLPEGDAPPTFDPPKPSCPRCDCPTEPPASGSCFDTMIAKQTAELAKAEHAKAFKAELEDLLKKASAAKAAYTRGKAGELTQRWLRLDKEIVRAISVITCNVPCWWCLIECEVCTLVYAIRALELEVGGGGAWMSDVKSQRDLEYWHQRNAEAKAAQFERFKAVLAVWTSPATTIEKALTVNENAVKAIPSADPVADLLQLFLKVIPLHLAIAPRGEKTDIGDKYVELCCDDDGVPDDCCGPDAGILPVRLQHLVGPQPYIVDPDQYFGILCCLVEHRYLPAKEQLAKATSERDAQAALVAAKTSELNRRRKSILEDASGSIARPVNCTDAYKPKEGEGPGCCDGAGSTRRPG
jgi:hypothetical protein